MLTALCLITRWLCTRYTVLGLHFGMCAAGGDIGEGKWRNSNLSLARLRVCAVDEFGQEKCGKWHSGGTVIIAFPELGI